MFWHVANLGVLGARRGAIHRTRAMFQLHAMLIIISPPIFFPIAIQAPAKCGPRHCKCMPAQPRRPKLKFWMPIPSFFIAVWGYLDAEISDQVVSNFTAWLRKCPGWGGAIYSPRNILDMARALPDDVREMAAPLLQCKPSGKVLWIQQADMARVVAVWYVGGVYLDVLDSVVEK
eukprot:6126011-Pyramimonas_sp.AAC.1